MTQRLQSFKVWLAAGLLTGSLVISLVVPSGVLAVPVPDGSIEAPYEISDCYELQDMNNDPEAHYVLVDDINCAATEEWNDGAGFAPIGGTNFMSSAFMGSLDGRGYAISGLHIDRPDEMTVGLFGSLVGGKAGNFDLTGTITGNTFVGGVAGVLFGEAEVTNVATQVAITGIATGEFGLGLPLSGVGGVAGFSFLGGTVSRSSSNSFVIATYTDEGISNFGGGLVGLMMEGSVLRDSYARSIVGSMEENVAAGGALGGLLIFIGEGGQPLVENTYAARGGVFVEDGGMAGGLIGGGQSSIVRNSFAASQFELSETAEAGGLMGFTDDMTLENNYYDAELSGFLDCLSDEVDANCIAVNTDGVPNPNYFLNTTSRAPLNAWDFTNIWQVQAEDYPLLNRALVDLHADPDPDPEPDPDPDTDPTPDDSPAESVTKLVTAAARNPATTLFPDQAAQNTPTPLSLDDFSAYLSGAGQQLTDLRVGQVIHFTVVINGVTEQHTITIKEIGPDYVILTIASDPFDVRLALNQPQTITLSGQPVLTVQLAAVAGQQVNLIFTKLAAAQPGRGAATTTPGTSPPAASSTVGRWFTIAAALALILIITILIKRQNRPA